MYSPVAVTAILTLWCTSTPGMYCTVLYCIYSVVEKLLLLLYYYYYSIFSKVILYIGERQYVHRGKL